MTLLPLPDPGPDAAVAWVRTHLSDLVDGEVHASPAFRGGQTAADARLATLDLAGYAATRSEVWPERRRGASRLSPYVRHGLLALPLLWEHARGHPPRDREKFRDELLWQEYARHLYARLGRRLGEPLRYAAPPAVALDADAPPPGLGDGWPAEMACLDLTVGELVRDGWLVNQTRMWLASHWAVREGLDWRAGEDLFFRHLLDGSRAANRTGWQWTVGTGTGKVYGFARQQVQRRAPGLCDGCALRRACPIERWPDPAEPARLPDEPLVRADPDPARTGGPTHPWRGDGEPTAVWLTAESLGDDDPALAAHPDLPAVFVLDEALLARLRLAGPRLVFLVETLADLADRRRVEVHRGDPVEVLADRPVAATFAPVPGWRRRATALRPVAVHPWPWLRRPHAGPVGSFSAWRRAADRGAGGSVAG